MSLIIYCVGCVLSVAWLYAGMIIDIRRWGKMRGPFSAYGALFLVPGAAWIVVGVLVVTVVALVTRGHS